MLDMGFKRQIDLCVHHSTMAKDRVTLMFSATFPNEISRGLTSSSRSASWEEPAQVSLVCS